MCPEPNDGACIRCRRPAPPIDSDESTEWETVVSESGMYLGIACRTCISDAQQVAIRVGGEF
jgi:hypothetical protein